MDSVSVRYAEALFAEPKGQEDKFNVVYVYSLINEKYQYPKGKSNILYIGHTRGQIHNGKDSLGFRFRHCCLGDDNKQNVTLMEYVHTLCKALLLEIYIIKDDCAIVESNKRYEFLMKFGSLPIADGASYNKKKIQQVSELIEIEDS